MKKIKNLSVVLATFNEEENIKDCLNSVKDLASEIIVVDGSSTDRTREIAKSLGAKVFKTTNKPMFHINKQLGLEKATKKWILQLDADERTTSELKKEIQSTISNPQAANGYYIPRKNYFLTGFLTKGGQYPDYVIRLVKKGKAYFPCQSVHEQIKVVGQAGYLKNDLIHLANLSLSRYLKNVNRYTTLTAQKLLKENVSLDFFNKLKYLVWLPIKTFFNIYIRHKGFMDGFPGFVFSLFSGLHHLIAFIKYWEKKTSKKDFSLAGDWE